MQSVQQGSQPILIEGANALMLDLDFGTYPYVTSVSIPFAINDILPSLTDNSPTLVWEESSLA